MAECAAVTLGILKYPSLGIFEVGQAVFVFDVDRRRDSKGGFRANGGRRVGGVFVVGVAILRIAFVVVTLCLRWFGIATLNAVRAAHVMRASRIRTALRRGRGVVEVTTLTTFARFFDAPEDIAGIFHASLVVLSINTVLRLNLHGCTRWRGLDVVIFLLLLVFFVFDGRRDAERRLRWLRLFARLLTLCRLFLVGVIRVVDDCIINVDIDVIVCVEVIVLILFILRG